MANNLPTKFRDDISVRVQDYFSQMEKQSTELNRELELLKTQVNDLEKNLHTAEDRAERAEGERDRAVMQRDDALQKMIAAATFWATILNAAKQGESLFMSTASSLRQAPISGAPTRNNGNRIAEHLQTEMAKTFADDQPDA
jgi:chromosome segregation ATPase